MKLVGVMVVRSEDWVLGCSLPAALKWCDEVILVDHASSDRTYEIYLKVSGENPRRVHYSRWEPTKKQELWSPSEGKNVVADVVDSDAPWDEMAMREHSLQVARKHNATHIAIIDADEILTANLLDRIRGQFDTLAPGMQLDVPMLAMRTLDQYEDANTVWSRAWLTLGFSDAPNLTWKPSADGYQHHHRSPYGITADRRFLTDKREGGVFHLQFANRRRLIAKHWLYAYTDLIRWPNRETPAELSFKYSQALSDQATRTAVPAEWWYGYNRSQIKLSGLPWQELKLSELIRECGEESFKGITLTERRPV